jgi:hypothetical protein
MKRLSRELAFEDAARVRDRIILMRKRLAGEDGGEEDSEVALAIAAAPKQKAPVRNWRRSRRDPDQPRKAASWDRGRRSSRGLAGDCRRADHRGR